MCARFDQQARAKTARQLLQVWRDGGNYFAARPYFDLLYEEVVSRVAGRPITPEDLPDDLAERALAARSGRQRHE